MIRWYLADSPLTCINDSHLARASAGGRDEPSSRRCMVNLMHSLCSQTSRFSGFLSHSNCGFTTALCKFIGQDSRQSFHRLSHGNMLIGGGSLCFMTRKDSVADDRGSSLAGRHIPKERYSLREVDGG